MRGFLKQNVFKSNVSPEDRISAIKNFVIGHRFLVGAEYRVYMKENDKPVIDFKRLREDQIWSFQASLKAHSMDHIELVVHKIEEALTPKQKRRKERHERKNYGNFKT